MKSSTRLSVCMNHYGVMYPSLTSLNNDTKKIFLIYMCLLNNYLVITVILCYHYQEWSSTLMNLQLSFINPIAVCIYIESCELQCIVSL